MEAALAATSINDHVHESRRPVPADIGVRLPHTRSRPAAPAPPRRRAELRPAAKVLFPAKLHEMLSDSRASAAVSWCAQGRAFAVRDRALFMAEVAPRFFKATKIRSFHRQLHLWGFHRISAGRDLGAFWHESFVRGRPELLGRIVRTRIKGKAACLADMPDFGCASVGPGAAVLAPAVPPVDPAVVPAAATPRTTNSGTNDELGLFEGGAEGPPRENAAPRRVTNDEFNPFDGGPRGLPCEKAAPRRVTNDELDPFDGVPRGLPREKATPRRGTLAGPLPPPKGCRPFGGALARGLPDGPGLLGKEEADCDLEVPMVAVGSRAPTERQEETNWDTLVPIAGVGLGSPAVEAGASGPTSEGSGLDQLFPNLSNPFLVYPHCPKDALANSKKADTVPSMYGIDDGATEPDDVTEPAVDLVDEFAMFINRWIQFP